MDELKWHKSAGHLAKANTARSRRYREKIKLQNRVAWHRMIIEEVLEPDDISNLSRIVRQTLSYESEPIRCTNFHIAAYGFFLKMNQKAKQSF